MHEGWSVTRIPVQDEEVWEGGEEVRIMRVGWADVGDVLDRDVEAEHRAWAERDHTLLRLVRDMAEEWECSHNETGASCIREMLSERGSDRKSKQRPSCQIISPHPGPENDHISIIGDLATPTGSLSFNGSEAPDSVPIGWAPNAGNVYHSVAALFRVPRIHGEGFEDSWSEAIANISKGIGGEVFVEAQGPQGGPGDQTGKWYLSVSFLRPRFGHANCLIGSVCPNAGVRFFCSRNRSLVEPIGSISSHTI